MRIPLILLSTVVAIGCKGKPTQQEPPPTAPVVGSGSGSGSGSDSAAAKPPTPEATRIPVRTNTPPNKTTAPLTEAKLKELAAKTFETFKSDIRRDNAKGMEVRFTTKIRPFIAATISIQPCFDCIPMELDKWKAKEDALKALWPKELWTQPGSVFEPAVYDFSGQPMISIYQLGQVSKVDENENPDATYGHAYIMHYNDGINSIRVVAEYRDMPMRNVETLGKVIPRESLEKLAQSFMDVYTHAW